MTAKDAVRESLKELMKYKGPGKLAKDTPWGREYLEPGGIHYCESKFLTGEASVDAPWLQTNWKKLSPAEKLDFLNNYRVIGEEKGKGGKRLATKEEAAVLRFLMGAAVRSEASIMNFASYNAQFLPDRGEAFRFLSRVIRTPRWPHANAYQALGLLGDARAVALLRGHLEKALRDPGLMKAREGSAIAADAAYAAEALRRLAPADRFPEAVLRLLAEHPSFRVRNAVRLALEGPVAHTQTLQKELAEREAVLSGHFLLSSGLHSDRYVQCAKLLRDASYASQLGRALSIYSRFGAEPDLVVSPAMGGLFIGHEVAKALRKPHIFTERENGVMTLRRGFEIKPGQKTVIVEDVLTTGKSSREVMEVIRARGGEVLRVLSIIDRGVDPAVLGVPHSSLIKLDVKTYKPDECPLCKQGLPAVKPGSRTQPK